ncbi:hypothetical protein QR721_08115 [Aciduricibacillus chroicocephali]|uniref:DUF3679 domain-containing protein n=1 Tax=Aciduricibacillus chroicocephali TaxID=3054939 RepID=A0ABY9KVE5_9BACI|nr:hypothetical protein QR721_08115 [Bacillaceae bacterium 44XB]
MKKGLLWFGLFLAVFFMGMHTAGGKTSDEEAQQKFEIQQETPQTDLPILPETEMQAESDPVFLPVEQVPEQSEGLLTNKTASVMERAVSVMYNVIVNFLYSIASLLF